jgi:thiol-disulfide isomerase/thioredoxin
MSHVARTDFFARWLRSFGRFAIAVCAVGDLTLDIAYSQAPTNSPTTEKGNADAKPADAKPTEPDPGPIAVPDGKPEELLAFIDKIKGERSSASDRESIIKHMTRTFEAVITAADKIAAASPNEAEATRAINEKITALLMLGRTATSATLAGGPMSERLKKYLDELANDPRPFVPPLARVYVLGTKLQNVDRNNPVEVEQLVAEVREHVRKSKLDGRNLSLAFQTARLAEMSGDMKLAGETYREFAAVFAKSDDPQVVANAKKLEGAARLVALPGNVIEVKGKLLDGSAFHWDSYRGKTVLVDFWATWCGPCVAELPNVKDAYAKYHERGFDVIGISLDQDKQRVDDFVKREMLPWPILFSDDPEATGWNHPLAEYYGIMAIPRAILVDKEGKVVSMSARGEELWDVLAKQIGPAVVKEPEADKAGKDADKKPDEKPVDDKPAAPQP